jgi:hypothetical protein
MSKSLFSFAGIALLFMSTVVLAGCPPLPTLTVGVNNLSTADTTPPLTGTVNDPNAAIQVQVDGGTSHTATNNGNGTWTLPDNTLAPLAPGTYTVQATATEGARTATGTGQLTITDTVTEARLYISNFSGNSVVSYLNPSTVNGNIAPDTNLSGVQTQLNQPSDAVVDGNGNLLVSNFGTPSVTGYANAAAASGNQAPNRNVQGGATQLAAPTTIARLNSPDLLFVANITTDHITVYANASLSNFNGNLAPTRVITSAALNNPFGINFGAGDTLYVANNGDDNILVFEGAAGLNGNVAPTRILTSAAFASIYDVFVDVVNDRMFVVNSGGNINVFNNASTLNAAVNPDFTLTVQGAGFLTGIVVDSGGVGYIVDNTLSRIYSYNNIATLNGTLNPNRTIAGANTQLNGSIRVFLSE